MKAGLLHPYNPFIPYHRAPLSVPSPWSSIRACEPSYWRATCGKVCIKGQCRGEVKQSRKDGDETESWVPRPCRNTVPSGPATNLKRLARGTLNDKGAAREA